MEEEERCAQCGHWDVVSEEQPEWHDLDDDDVIILGGCTQWPEWYEEERRGEYVGDDYPPREPHYRSKPCRFEGQTFPSIAEAEKTTGHSRDWLRARGLVEIRR